MESINHLPLGSMVIHQFTTRDGKEHTYQLTLQERWANKVLFYHQHHLLGYFPYGSFTTTAITTSGNFTW